MFPTRQYLILEKPKVTYPFREAAILAYGPAMSTEKKNEKWKTFLGEGSESGVQSFSLPMGRSCAWRTYRYQVWKQNLFNTEDTEGTEKASRRKG